MSARAPRPRTHSANADHRRHENRPIPAHYPDAPSGPMSRGELYAYYKRMGMLQVYFTLFPGG